MVEPSYQPGNGLSRWNSSAYGLAPPRLQGYYNLHAGGCLVDILSTNRKKDVPKLDTSFFHLKRKPIPHCFMIAFAV